MEGGRGEEKAHFSPFLEGPNPADAAPHSGERGRLRARKIRAPGQKKERGGRRPRGEGDTDTTPSPRQPQNFISFSFRFNKIMIRWENGV